MIDIHCHILPGIDDGPKNMDESVAMAEIAVQAGTTMVFATPHVNTSEKDDVCRKIAEKTAELRSELDSRSIALEIVHGAEVYPACSVIKAVESGSPITLGNEGRYILLDTPLTLIPMGFEQLIFDLQSMCITPILAHPERSKAVQEDPQILEPFLQRGALIQSNAGSVVGSHGCLAQVTVQNMIRHNWVHFIASDAHSTGHRRTKLRAAREELVDLIGEEQTNQLFIENGKRVCEGEAVPTDPAAYSMPRKRTWFGQLFRKDLCGANTGR
jgi:protein-tyrosine phosphatase